MSTVPRPPDRPTAATPPLDPPDPNPPDTDEVFSTFYRGFLPRLVAFLLWQGARLTDAADIAQDTMIKAYQHWSEVRSPEAWARTVASRELIRRIVACPEDPHPAPPECPLLPAVTNVEAWEQQHDILRLLADLPPRQRQVLAWTMEGYTPTEIADELGITPEPGSTARIVAEGVS
jgi:RNA polymerase sigma factor (sigma-70 family)